MFFLTFNFSQAGLITSQFLALWAPLNFSKAEALKFIHKIHNMNTIIGVSKDSTSFFLFKIKVNIQDILSEEQLL